MTTRREFLAGSLGLAAAASMWPFAAAAGPGYPIVDTHTHFYDPQRPQGVPWPGKDDKSLYRQVLPEHFEAFAKPLGVTGTVIVEASPWVEDNQWVLDIADHDPFVLGLVGNLTPGKPEFAGHVKRFAANRRFRGIRVNSGPLKTGLDKAEFLADIKRLADADLELDINGGPELLPLVDQLATKLPDLRIVINHLANVKIDGPHLNAEWQAGMQAAARHKQVFLKVSALVESAARDGRTAPKDPQYYFPILESVWQTWGEDRLIYGSNWPVSDRAGDYATVLKIVSEFFQSKGRAATEKFFAKNAKAAYRWS
ncbi:MAG: amidohydrolase family protein [Planctomycetes bacterium]|nr:amidohydrolase family protein [Planctomycetota bacterium]